MTRVKLKHRSRWLSDDGPGFVHYYNTERYHESLDNLRLADAY